MDQETNNTTRRGRGKKRRYMNLWGGVQNLKEKKRRCIEQAGSLIVIG